MDYFICHYHEIGLKGKNRKFFEQRLVENIKKAIPKKSFLFVKRISGRIIIKLSKSGKEEEIKNSLKNVFGLSHFSLSVFCEQKIETIKKKALEILKNQKFKSFRITTQRSKKEFSLTSGQINEKIGEFIVKKLNKKVNLKKPDITCFIEIVEKYTFLYLEKIKGAGGLPVGVSNKAVVLLSGGIDSPVAAFYAMRRGVKVIFLHFHSEPYTEKASIEKAKRIVDILNKFQFNSKLYLTPFASVQKEILLKTPAPLRVILYRRMMLRIAQKIAQKEKAGTIITGESIGQVASQTLENIRAVEQAADLLVLRPVIGHDKQDIIDKAQEIGTFEVSILPHQDCCSLFVPKHPETRAKLEEVKRAEKGLNIRKLVDTAVKETLLQKIEKS